MVSKAIILLTFLMVVVMAGVAACRNVAAEPRFAPTLSEPVYGMNFSPYNHGQDPNINPRIQEDQIRGSLRLIKAYTRRIRIFGSTDGLERIPAIARAMGFKVAAGAWIGRDLAANDRQLANLIKIGKAGSADTLCVGSEVLLRGELTEDALLAYIARVKSAVPAVPVAYADTYNELLKHPRVMAAVDVVFANFYPYWEGIYIDDAVATIEDSYMQLETIARDKPVIVGEVGWPSAGNTVGRAIPSNANAAKFFVTFVSWAKQRRVDFYYFQAQDELWKSAYEGPQGKNWGVFDTEGNLKPGMRQVFEGKTVPDNWSVPMIPGGPGAPALKLTAMPDYGSFSALEGRALHVAPPDFKVGVYILVRSGWWVKPTAANPLTTISRDGGWIVDIATGVLDSQATKIAVFLLPSNYKPPILLGEAAIPDDLKQQAVAIVEVSRRP